MDWSQGATEKLPWKLSTPKAMLKFFILVEPRSCKEYLVKSIAAALHPSLSLAKKNKQKKET